jgi:hypothetical protein
LRTYRGIFNKGSGLIRLYAFTYWYFAARLPESEHKEYKLGRKKFSWQYAFYIVNAAIDEAREAQDQVDKGKNSDTHILTPSKGEKLPEEVKSSPIKSKTLLSPLKVKNIVYQPYKLTLCIYIISSFFE